MGQEAEVGSPAKKGDRDVLESSRDKRAIKLSKLYLSLVPVSFPHYISELWFWKHTLKVLKVSLDLGEWEF